VAKSLILGKGPCKKNNIGWWSPRDGGIVSPIQKGPICVNSLECKTSSINTKDFYPGSSVSVFAAGLVLKNWKNLFSSNLRSPQHKSWSCNIDFIALFSENYGSLVMTPFPPSSLFSLFLI
jgi:hypothetical protein